MCKNKRNAADNIGQRYRAQSVGTIGGSEDDGVVDREAPVVACIHFVVRHPSSNGSSEDVLARKSTGWAIQLLRV